MWEASKHMHCKLQPGFGFKECVKQESQDTKAIERNYQIEIHSLIYSADFNEKSSHHSSEWCKCWIFRRNVFYNIS